MAENEQYVSFEEFCKLVGANEPSVRTALEKLDIKPRRDLADRRRIVYPASEAPRVREWLLKQV